MKKTLKRLRMMMSLKKTYLKESILEAANKVLDFEEFKKQQEDAINNFNENLLNKNKRKAIEKEEQLIEIIKVPEKRKQQKDKAAQIAAKKILKKYKTIRFWQWKMTKKL